MPRQFSFRGDRLAYSWGIVAAGRRSRSACWSSFGGDTHALIPLYSVGVFVCFTLSQIGMVRHWLTVRESRLAVAGGRSTGSGAVLTAVVLVVVVSEKFDAGRLPRRDPRPDARRDDAVHPAASTRRSKRELAVEPGPGRPRPRTARSASSSRSRASTGPSSRPSTSARSISDDVRAVYITDDPDLAAQAARPISSARSPGVPLVVVESPYRALVGPLLAYLDVLDAAWPPDKHAPITFVVIPEYVARALVGADPVQPVRQAAAHRAARPAAHRGRRTCPIGARTGDVFDARRRRGRGRDRRRRRPDAARRPLSPAATGGIVTAAMSETHTPAFQRAVVALNGGPSDARIVEARRRTGTARQGRAHRRPRRRDRLDAARSTPTSPAARRRSSASSTPPSRSPRTTSMTLEPVLLQARDVGAAHRRRGHRARRRPAGRRAAVSQAVRRRIRHRPDHPLHPAERTVRRLGRPRADHRGASVKIVIVGCGRVGASVAEAYDRAGHQVLVIDSLDRRLRPAAVLLRRHGDPRRRHRRGRRSAGPAPRVPTSSWP